MFYQHWVLQVLQSGDGFTCIFYFYFIYYFYFNQFNKKCSWWSDAIFNILSPFCRFLIVLSCLILSVLSTIDQYQALAQETLFWVVSFYYYVILFHPFYFSALSKQSLDKQCVNKINEQNICLLTFKKDVMSMSVQQGAKQLMKWLGFMEWEWQNIKYRSMVPWSNNYSKWSDNKQPWSPHCFIRSSTIMLNNLIWNQFRIKISVCKANSILQTHLPGKSTRYWLAQVVILCDSIDWWSA